MKSLLILAASSLLVGCGLPQFPKFPASVEYTYVVDINPATKEVGCEKFKITSTKPIVFQYVESVDLLQCQGLLGFQPKDAITVKNYIDDVQDYSTKVRCKLK